MDMLHSLRAPVFNIVNGSFVDGYGVRTTIFLKGCPLRCKWCCNPEGQSFRPQLRFLTAHCSDGCSRCVSACPEGALSKDGSLVIRRAACTDCAVCLSFCWYDALKMYGEWYTAEELFPRILREKAYITASGGGLTIGGGEATCWPAFCLRLIELCHGEGISVAVDSCGYMLYPESLRVLEAADLILFDLKGMDSYRHQENTGVPNKEILDTFRHLTQQNKPVIVRLPLIPGLNDSPQELEQLAQLLADSPNVERVDLMFYHEYGCSKYDEIGMDYPLKGKVCPYTPQQCGELLRFFQGYGLPVQDGG